MPDAAARARALCAALALDDPAARETVAGAMREVEREAHVRGLALLQAEARALYAQAAACRNKANIGYWTHQAQAVESASQHYGAEFSV